MTIEQARSDFWLLTPALLLVVYEAFGETQEDAIYDSTKRFFDAPTTTAQSSGSTDDGDRQDQHRPKKFKDVIREQILEQMNQSDDDMDNSDGDDDVGSESFRSDARTKLAYDQQQDDLRKAFLDESAKLETEIGDDGDSSQGSEKLY